MRKKLKTDLGAVEYPWGVMQFAKDCETTALQRYSYLTMTFPGVINTIEQALPDLPKLV